MGHVSCPVLAGAHTGTQHDCLWEWVVTMHLSCMVLELCYRFALTVTSMHTKWPFIVTPTPCVCSMRCSWVKRTWQSTPLRLPPQSLPVTSILPSQPQVPHRSCNLQGECTMHTYAYITYVLLYIAIHTFCYVASYIARSIAKCMYESLHNFILYNLSPWHNA